jgi:hypothetical protein
MFNAALPSHKGKPNSFEHFLDTSINLNKACLHARDWMKFSLTSRSFEMIQYLQCAQCAIKITIELRVCVSRAELLKGARLDFKASYLEFIQIKCNFGYSITFELTGIKSWIKLYNSDPK